MRPLEIPISILATFALFLFACKPKEEEKADKQPPKEPIARDFPKQLPRPASIFVEPAKPFKLFCRYQGSIGGNQPITMDMTLENQGGGTWTHGTYADDEGGKPQEFYGHLADTGFAFELSDARGGPERFSGPFSSYESFEGTWIKNRIDSSFDSATYNWKVTETRISLPFRLGRSTADFVPVRFEFYSRENDSLAKWNIAEHRIEYPYDSMPSRMSITLLQVEHPDKKIGATLNRNLTRSLLGFYGHRGGEKHPESQASLADMLEDFDRSWRDSHGAFFDDDFDCDVMANRKDFLSVRFEINSYAGGPHPDLDHSFATFDTRTGKKLALADLLVPGYEKKLGYAADPPFCNWEVGSDITCPTEDLVENGFALMPDGILFRPRIAGYPMDILVPHGNMAKLIRRDGLLAQFVKP